MIRMRQLFATLVIVLIFSVPAQAKKEEKPAASFDEKKADAATEQAVLDIAAAAQQKAASKTWGKYKPQIKVSPFGQEIRILVSFDDKKMGKENVAAIQSVKLESDKGEFLGLKTYGATEISREAEFMVNPQILKIDKVKVTVVSSADGEYSETASLEIKEAVPPPAPAAVEAKKAVNEAAKELKEIVKKETEAAVPAVSEKKSEKKKGWF